MGTVIALSAARTLEIEDAIITGAEIDEDGHLILTRNDATTVDAGLAQGTSGAVSVDDLEDVPPGTAAGTPVFLRS